MGPNHYAIVLQRARVEREGTDSDSKQERTDRQLSLASTDAKPNKHDEPFNPIEF